MGDHTVANPCARQSQTMGPQSQRRLTLQERTHQLQAANSFGRKRKGGQRTIGGGVAFEPNKDCGVCKAKLAGRNPHRAHHPLCWNNKRTKGVSASTLAANEEGRASQKLFNTPLAPSEKASWRHSTKEAGERFFAARPKGCSNNDANTTSSSRKTSDQSAAMTEVGNNAMSVADPCKGVTNELKDSAFCKDHEKTRAPLAMLALAGVVVDEIVRSKQTRQYFEGLTLTVPACKEMHSSPHCHSIVGQKLPLVDWQKTFGLDLDCPGCNGRLQSDRTNFSKNKVLFPMFELIGAPSWAMVMSMKCQSCKSRCNANDGAMLSRLPACAASAYPVECKCALSNRNCHLGRSATAVVIDSLMTTCGNGDSCSRLLCTAINRAHLERVADCHSHNANAKTNCQPHILKDGQCIKAHPPLGDLVRDIHDDAPSNPNNPWKTSDDDRHQQEIQGVGCELLCAEDNTHSVTKNHYRRRQIGAFALWDMATETAEIASAALVPSTKTIDLSHAAIQVSRRPNFKPLAMCSDRWPTKNDCWERLFGSQLEGRLGLFHFSQRIMKTLRKRHIDYFLAVNLLLDAVHFHFEFDYEKLLVALKTGALSCTGKKYTDEDIADLKATKYFRQRHAKHSRKVTRPANVMRQRLDGWFARFKCSASSGTAVALGRLDSVTKETLFTPTTRMQSPTAKTKPSAYRILSP